MLPHLVGFPRDVLPLLNGDEGRMDVEEEIGVGNRRKGRGNCGWHAK